MLLNHQMTGSGPALFLLHSTAADSRQWDAQRGRLSAAHTVVTPDFRGYGQSPLSSEPFDHAHDVLVLMDHLGIEVTALVGSSGGGQVAQQVAALWPERVNALMLLCSAADGVDPTPELESFLEREDALLEEGDIEGATALNVATWLGPEADAEAYASLAVMQEHAFRVQRAAGVTSERDIVIDLTAITAPTSVVCGRHDLDFFGVVGRFLTDAISAAVYTELDWAGHLPNLERRDAMANFIARWAEG